jgi:riboflavin kinase / FMN adenylyltransferase
LFDEVLDTAALRISSSSIRHDLHAGHVLSANQSLGYDYAISGRVIHGRKLGRTLKCPTLNLIPRLTNPALRGVIVVAIDGLRNAAGVLEPRLYGVASLGLRPTVEQTTRFSLEVHVFDWSGDAYGQRVTVTFLHKLRDEQLYAGLPALQAAIAKDMLDARAWLAQVPQQ